MNILGFSGLNHNIEFKKKWFPHLSQREYRIAQGFDSAAVLITDDEISFAAAEERFTREKGTSAFPIRSIRKGLEVRGLRADDIDVIAHSFSYQPVQSCFEQDEFHRQLYKNVYSSENQIRILQYHFPSIDWTEKFVPVPHHTAHAASTFYVSGLEEAVILVSDGMGEINSMTAFVATKTGLEIIQEIPAFHSLGILYGVFTLYLGFYLGLDEYKVMGLAPYGDSRRYFEQIMKWVHLRDDGTYTIPLFAHNKTLEEQETHRGVLRILTEIFGPTRIPESDLTQHHKDLAAAIQAVCQTCQLHVLRSLKQKTGQTNLCLAGGVALNCTANGVIRRSRMFRNIFVQPASGDDGAALGAALHVRQLREPNRVIRKMALPLWGPEFDEQEIEEEISGTSGCTSMRFHSFDELIPDIAQRIADGKIIAWFQGRMEFGPRALGNRSILADPRSEDMRDRINALIKKREGFRPFAPAVTKEAASKFFDIRPGDEDGFAHMLFVTQVRSAYRSYFPSITHVDGSARVQTVDCHQHPHFWALLEKFGRLTGFPIILNTSFNVRGQPIVCTPREAIDTFLWAQLDVLVMGKCVVTREISRAPDNPEAVNVVFAAQEGKQ